MHSQNFYEFLRGIKIKYPLYTGGSSILQLQGFIDGYFFAKEKFGIELTEDEKDFGENFHKWVEERTDVKTHSSWSKILQLRSSHDQQAAELFFELLDKFIERDKTKQEEKEQNNSQDIKDENK